MVARQLLGILVVSLAPSRMSVFFGAEEGGLVTCSTEADEREVFSTFRNMYVQEAELTPDSMMLFKVSIDDGAKSKPTWYVGVPHAASFNDVLELFNRKFSGNGAFLLKGGFGVRPMQSAGQVFMKYGYELEFHPKVDITRVAWHQRS